MPGPREANALEIVDKFDSMDGTDYGDQTSNETDDEEVEGEEDTSSDDQGGSDDGEDNSDEPSSRTQEGERGAKDKSASDALRPLPGGNQQDAAGNLYDSNGRMLARAGSERRLYERSVRLTNEVANLSQRNQQLEQLVRSSGNVGEEPTRLGLNADDLRVGYPIIAEFKRDPVTATRKMLEMVMGMGHNLSQILGQDAKDAVEMGAISRMLDERLAPLNELRQSAAARQREEQVRTQATQEVERFFDSHDFSRVHADAIDSLMGRRQDLTPEQAYYELRVFAAKNGLDFTKPLAPQMQQASARQTNNRQQTRRSVPTIPQGRGGNQYEAMPEAEALPANATWDDIIKRSLRSN